MAMHDAMHLARGMTQEVGGQVAAGKAGDTGDKCAQDQALLLTQGQWTRQLNEAAGLMTTHDARRMPDDYTIRR